MHGRKLLTIGTVATLAILALVGGCKEATTGPTSVNPQDFASNLKLLSGNQQKGVVGAPLSELLTVKVVDAGGLPVSGATVIWQVRNGGGTVSPAASTTGSSGLAAVTWTVGTDIGDNNNKVVAVLQGAYVLDSAVFTASTKEGPPASMTLTSGNGLTATVGQRVSSVLSVTLRDRYGHPVPNVRVSWLPLTTQSGTVAAVKDTTGVDGVSTANWTAGTVASTQMAAARVTGLPDVLFSVLPTPDVSRVLTYVAGNNQSAARGLQLSTPLSVKVTDKYNNIIAGDTIIWNDSVGGGGSITPTRGVTDANGLSTAAWTLGAQLGAQALRARISTSAFTFAALAGVGTPKNITSAGSGQAARVAAAVPVSLSVVVKDSLGQAVPGLTVAWATPNTGGALTGQAVTQADGSATATWTLGTVKGAQSATATIQSVAAPVAFTATAAPDTSRQFTIVGGNSQTKGVGLQLTDSIAVRLTDRFGNFIVGDSIIFNDSTTGLGTLSQQTVATDANGLAKVAWTLGPMVGRQTLRARPQGRQERLSFSATATVQYTDVVVGNFHACGVATTLKVYCWGLNDAGQLGRGNNRPTTAPTAPVAYALDSTTTASALYARQLTGSRSAVCAVTPAQDVYCWGKAWGAIAQTSLPALSTVKANAGSGTPLAIRYLQVAEDHACLIQVSGVTNCTGNNDRGQLGDKGAGPPFSSPSAGTWPYVESQASFSNIQLGTSFTCGFHRYLSEVSAVVPDSSQLPLCWGDGTEGQRGDSSTSNALAAPKNASVPLHIKVKSLVAGITFDSASLAVGDKHACVIVASNSPSGTGDAYCWGANAHNQLGRATTGTGAAARDSVAGKVGNPAGGAVAYVRLFAGKYHTCGLTAVGTAYCWGRNDYGQLGNGVQLPFNTGTATPQLVGGGLAFKSLSLGELSTCGITGTPTTAMGPSAQSGTVYCWGDNNFGQLGNSQSSGANAPVLNPVKVTGQP